MSRLLEWLFGPRELTPEEVMDAAGEWLVRRWPFLPCGYKLTEDDFVAFAEWAGVPQERSRSTLELAWEEYLAQRRHLCDWRLERLKERMSGRPVKPPRRDRVLPKLSTGAGTVSTKRVTGAVS